MKHTLIIATNNRGKVEEFRALLSDLPFELLSLADIAKEPESEADSAVRSSQGVSASASARSRSLSVIEDGVTFIENAIKKARAVAAATMALTLADDSGLEVDALGGKPGVRSARFAHDRATDAENNAALLHALEDLRDPTQGASPPSVTARFRCALALIDPYSNDGEPLVVEGSCEGEITRTPHGSGGFGYDPLFVVHGLKKTMADLTPEEKNQVSHRARAISAMRLVLEKVLAGRDELIERVARGERIDA